MTLPAVGLFGGTFDPFHHAHLRMARAFRDEIGLERLLLVPAGEPYHRAPPEPASAWDRLAMTRLAVRDEPAMEADDREIRRDAPSYTVDTLAELRGEIGPRTPLWFLIGGDSLANLPGWKDWERLFRLANLAVALRPGFHPDTLPPEVARHWHERQVADFSNQRASGTIRPLRLPPVDLSATRIREAISRGEDVSALVPAPVLRYIGEHRLYR
ncbi:nicotinate-nucleotide adenylyltransferase [Paludibacterium paludis]|uniref:Probable nicotinate-nucleotide adenylyltransferase n=1 Tax=Paludibacterium paludis TaxID=1225769 RepID=A0A918P2G3_9NEIS|nr:nicotinate-nucleotide adenylyltransferase [Paludibacterium paludis]GGY15911.1 putative nicotinate-nucleotide adenylyltransferase [Paludibacterium paludis]